MRLITDKTKQVIDNLFELADHDHDLVKEKVSSEKSLDQMMLEIWSEKILEKLIAP